MKAILTAAFIAFTLLCAIDPANAQSIQLYDPTVRSAGMGGVSSATFWEPMSSSWTNPAALGYQRGLTYEWGSSEWKSISGWSMTSNRLAVGDRGIGVMLAGEPANWLGGTSFEYDNNVFELPEGNVRSFAFGVSIAELAANILSKLGHPGPDISRYGDVSFGMTFTNTKQVTTTINPPSETDTDTSDYGFLFRLTPYNSVEHPGLEPALDELLDPILGGLRIDAAYGFARHDYSEHAPFRLNQKGGAIRFSSGTPGVLDEWLSNTGLGWLAKSLSPFLSFGIGWDDKDTIFASFDPRSEEGPDVSQDADLSGWELGIANIFTLRRGEFGDLPFDEFMTTTDGWGLGFRAGDYGSFRYDRATFEHDQSTYRGVTINLNALAILNALHGKR